MRYIVEWLEHLAVNAKVATVLGSIPASSDTVEYDGRQIKQCCIMYLDKKHKNPPLKVSTNEKIGGLKVVAFHRSLFKLFSLRFSKKSAQAPSCRRYKTTQRALFMSFAFNNYLQITA